MHAPDLPRHVGVAIVGSGFAGVAAAVALRRAGRRDLVVLERSDDLGGTWRDNTYPGCTCDVPSHLYSFSFAPNPDWSRSYAAQPEIEAYLRRTADRFGVTEHVRCRAELLRARWNSDRQHWRVTTSRGELTADVLVLATGPLSEPAIPDLPGLETFSGTAFHSSRWDHGHVLDGERVAVVGTGASAVQLLPHVRRRAGHVTVFQRTAPWVLPRRDRDIARAERALFRRLPAAQRLARTGIYWGRESLVLGFVGPDRVMRLAERQALAFLRREVREPDLRARLTPHYRLGCKRVLLSSDYYATLTQRDVDLVTDRITAVLPRALVTHDAAGRRTEHPVDTIVLGTGFRVTRPVVAERLVGRDGRTLAEHWDSTGMQALHGTTVAGFPNLFLLGGPNTGLGHSSVVLMIEAQVAYVMAALASMRQHRLTALEPRPQAQTAWTAAVQRRLERTVWNAGGCASWYLDDHGRNTTMWPGATFAFRRQLRSFPLADYAPPPLTPDLDRRPSP